MLRRLLSSSVVVAALCGGLLVACDAAGGGEGEGEGERPAEGEGEGEEGEGEGEGEGEDEPAAFGEVCGAAGCEANLLCGTLFQGNIPNTCLPTCPTPGETCTVTGTVQGTCSSVAAGNVCVADAPLMGLCGNGVSSGCATEGAACGIAGTDNPATPVDDTVVGFCIIPCGADDTCADATLACSDDFQVTTAPNAPAVGVCVPPTTAGQTCGPGADGSLTICTGTQSCGGTDALTCQEDPPPSP